MTPEKVMAKLLDPKKLKLPPKPKVAEIRFRPYIDSLGDEAWRLWVILDEGVTDDEREWLALAPVDRTIRDSLLKAGVKEFPYIRYAKNSELVEAGVVT
jgi:hypothetical protein